MRRSDLLRNVARLLEGSKVPRPLWEAEWICAKGLNTSRVDLKTHPEVLVSSLEVEECMKMAQRRAGHEPLEYLLLEAEFYGRPFKVGPGCLIPRPETELLVDKALQFLKERETFIDWGTGSGCIALTLLLERPFTEALCVDRSAVAIGWAWLNAKRWNLLPRCLFWRSENPLEILWGKREVGLVVSNPPYIPTDQIPTLMPEVRVHEPHIALDGGTDGLLLVRKLLLASSRWLRKGGRLLVEIGGERQACELARESPPELQLEECCPDLNGIPRILVWRKQ